MLNATKPQISELHRSKNVWQNRQLATKEESQYIDDTKKRLRHDAIYCRVSFISKHKYIVGVNMLKR